MDTAVTPPRSTFRNDIQGLRAIAVLAVLADHFDVPGLHGGFAGVDVFFVISGFLIVGLMHAEARRTGRVSLLAFYGRRARRILPAAMFVIAAVAALASLTLNPLAAADIRQEAGWATLFAINVLLIDRGADYFAQYDSVSPLQHYWSLAVEEQFYLVLPMLVLLTLAHVRRHPTRRLAPSLAALLAVLSVASLAWCAYATANVSATSAYFSSLTRAWQIGAGGLLAIAVARGRLVPSGRVADLAGAAGLLVLAAGFTTLHGDTYPGLHALVPVVGAGLLIAAGVQREGVVQRLVSLRPLTYTGLVSFSLYLWHWPIMIFLYHLRPEVQHMALRIPLLLAASMLAASLSYALVERPARGWTWARFAARRPRAAHTLRRHRVVLLVVAIAAAASTVGVGTMRQADDAPRSAAIAAPGALDARRESVERALRLERLPADLTPPLARVPEDREPMRCLTVDELIRDSCAWGDPDADRLVLVIGDSHAHMWFTAIQHAFPASRYRVQALTRGGCPTSDIAPPIDSALPGGEAACERHRAWVRDEIRRLEPDVVVTSEIAGSIHAGDGHLEEVELEEWRNGLTESLDLIASSAGTIVLIGQTPRAKALADCLPRSLELRPCVGDDAETAELRQAERAAVEAAGGVFVDPGPWLCAGDRCPPVIDGSAAYFDDNHVTVTMERQLAPLLAADVSALLDR